MDHRVENGRVASKVIKRKQIVRAFIYAYAPPHRRVLPAYTLLVYGVSSWQQVATDRDLPSGGDERGRGEQARARSCLSLKPYGLLWQSRIIRTAEGNCAFPPGLTKV